MRTIDAGSAGNILPYSAVSVTEARSIVYINWHRHPWLQSKICSAISGEDARELMASNMCQGLFLEVPPSGILAQAHSTHHRPVQMLHNRVAQSLGNMKTWGKMDYFSQLH